MELFKDTKIIAVTAVTAALYVALTLAFAPLSYGGDVIVQFRLSEILCLFCFLNPRLGPGLILGCFIANMFSPLGWYDLVFGTLGTVFSVLLMRRAKSVYTASLCPMIGNIIVGLELALLFEVEGLSFIQNLALQTGAVMLGEFVVVAICGNILFFFLMKNKYFTNLIKSI
jgi:uncharacterized membrane protein